MKIEHAIYESDCEILNKENNKISVEIPYYFYEDYTPQDFNIFFAISVLEVFNLLNKSTMKQYQMQRSDFLHEKVIFLPRKKYQGKLADDYTQLVVLQDKIHYAEKLDTQEIIQMVMNMATELDFQFFHHYPNEGSKTPFRMAESLLSEISRMILKEQNLKKLNQITWKRKMNSRIREDFDYSLPATMYLYPIDYDEKEYQKLVEITNQIIINYNVQVQQSQKVIVNIEFQNIP